MFLATITRVCAGDPARLARVLAGLRRYQDAAPATARLEHHEIARVGNVVLRDHGGAGPLVVVVPSLINPPTVLDLAPGNSLLDALVKSGLQVLMVDWGEPETLNLSEMVEARLVSLLTEIGKPMALVGYCLGGTMALAAASRLGASVSRLALLAAPWHFGNYGAAQGRLAEWWRNAAPLARRLGALPMELLQPAFWELDPDGLTTKYERFGTLPDDAETQAFTILEDWSNGGQPLAVAAAREMAEDLFRDNLPGRGSWIVGGRAVEPASLDIPILDIIAGRDRIVPPDAALTAAGPGTALRLDMGHVGMIVGRRAPDLLWHPLASWLAG